MEPWQSWAAALILGGGLALYYTQGTNVASRVKRMAQSTEQPQAPAVRKREDKKPTRNKSATSNLAEKSKQAVSAAAEATSSAISNVSTQAQKQKPGKKTVAPKPDVPSPQAVEEHEDEEDELGDKEWAAQLEARKKGVSLSTPSVTKRVAKRKQPKETLSDSVAGPSGSSMDYVASLTGRTPIPAQGPANGSAQVAGDISDMLEARGPAPTTLRIVGQEKPKKQPSPKAEVEQETKKQRQNRRKVEEQRLIREEQEKERQKLAEKQRRTAREARGEPAKNGLAPSNVPTSSVWSGPSQISTNAPEPTVQSNGVELLDTFDHDNVSTSSSNGAITNTTTPATANSTVSVVEQDYPSEEAQLERLSEMSGWAEVPKFKKGKKKAQAPLDESDAKETKQDIVATATRPIVSRAPKSELPQKSKQQATTNGFAALEEPQTDTAPRKGHPQDSEWL